MTQASTIPTSLRCAVTSPADTPLAFLTWSVPADAEQLVQVYVDGVLYDVTTEPSQRSMWVELDRLHAVRIELLAANADDVWLDQSDQLDAWSPAFVTAAELAIVRDESWPIDSRVIVSIDGEDDGGAWLWGPNDSRGGFGGLFGIGPFGFDTATSPGFGLGEFGVGPFLADGSAWRWRRDDLPPGEHTLDLRIEDAADRTIASMPQRTITIDAPPAPAMNLTLDETFTLQWA